MDLVLCVISSTSYCSPLAQYGQRSVCTVRVRVDIQTVHTVRAVRTACVSVRTCNSQSMFVPHHVSFLAVLPQYAMVPSDILSPSIIFDHLLYFPVCLFRLFAQKNSNAFIQLPLQKKKKIQKLKLRTIILFFKKFHKRNYVCVYVC